MSAPELPAIFGNYALGDFNEVIPPPDISWWPATNGWLIVAALAGFYVAKLAYRKLRLWWLNRYRREARQRLRLISKGPAQGQALVEQLNTLLKLTAMQADSRQAVAALSGEHWVTYLNNRCESAPFDALSAQFLARGSYQALPMDPTGRIALLTCCDTWLIQHRNAHA